jgi:hypothetical protein
MAVSLPFRFRRDRPQLVHSRRADEPSAVRESTEDPEELFTGLDGRRVTVAGRSWRLQVYGACDGGGPRWVQIGLMGATQASDDTRPHMLTLMLGPGEDVSHAVQALASWLANPSYKRNILSVA